MNTKILFNITIVLLCLIFFAGFWAGTAHFNDLPERISQSQSLNDIQGSIYSGDDISWDVLANDSPSILSIE